MNLSLIFNFANFFVLPFWILIIILPNWGITRKIMQSYLPFVPLAGLYVYLFASTLDPEVAQTFSNPQLADIARLFSQENIAATAWVHFIVLDLFVARYIYWEGQRTGIWTIHSLILCLFAGPLGLLTHIITTWVTKAFFPTTETEDLATSTPTS